MCSREPFSEALGGSNIIALSKRGPQPACSDVAATHTDDDPTSCCCVEFVEGSAQPGGCRGRSEMDQDGSAGNCGEQRAAAVADTRDSWGGKNRQGNGGRDDEARTWQRWDAASRWVPRWRARSQYTMRRHGGVRLTKFDRGPPGLRAWGPSRRLASRQGHHCGPLRATAGHRALRPCQTAARVGGCFAPDLRVRLPAHRGRDNFFLRGKQGSVRFFNRGSLLFFLFLSGIPRVSSFLCTLITWTFLPAFLRFGLLSSPLPVT